MSLRIRINKDTCIGCGTCMAMVEEVFEIDDDGLSRIRADNPNITNVDDKQVEGTITDPELEARVKEFIEEGLCASNAIEIIEEIS